MNVGHIEGASPLCSAEKKDSPLAAIPSRHTFPNYLAPTCGESAWTSARAVSSRKQWDDSSTSSHLKDSISLGHSLILSRLVGSVHTLR